MLRWYCNTPEGSSKTYYSTANAGAATGSYTLSVGCNNYNFHKNSHKFGISVASSLFTIPLVLSGVLGIILATILTFFGVCVISSISEKVDIDRSWKHDHDIITILVNEYVLSNPTATENRVFYYVTNECNSIYKFYTYNKV